MVVANTILPEPNAILRVLELLEINVPVVNVYPARSNVPEVNVVATVAVVNVTAPANVVVPVLLIVSVGIGLPLGVNVPVPPKIAVNPVYAPPELNVKLPKVNDVVPGSNAVVPKSTLLMLVSAFAGVDNIRNAYQHAIQNEYRFFSYGDAMFLSRLNHTNP